MFRRSTRLLVSTSFQEYCVHVERHGRSIHGDLVEALRPLSNEFHLHPKQPVFSTLHALRERYHLKIAHRKTNQGTFVPWEPMALLRAWNSNLSRQHSHRRGELFDPFGNQIRVLSLETDPIEKFAPFFHCRVLYRVGEDDYLEILTPFEHDRAWHAFGREALNLKSVAKLRDEALTCSDEFLSIDFQCQYYDPLGLGDAEVLTNQTVTSPQLLTIGIVGDPAIQLSTVERLVYLLVESGQNKRDVSFNEDTEVPPGIRKGIFIDFTEDITCVDKTYSITTDRKALH